MNIYVGNLSYTTTETDLRKQFENFGKLDKVKLVKDNFGKSKGFAFVEMPVDKEANTAIKDLNGMELNGRKIRVQNAQKTTKKKQVEKPEKKKFPEAGRVRGHSWCREK